MSQMHGQPVHYMPAPAYRTEKLPGTVKVLKRVYVPEKRSFEDQEIEEPAGYMVYLRRGHSIRVATRAELVRLGFHIVPRHMLTPWDTVDDMPNAPPEPHDIDDPLPGEDE